MTEENIKKAKELIIKVAEDVMGHMSEDDIEFDNNEVFTFGDENDSYMFFIDCHSVGVRPYGEITWLFDIDATRNFLVKLKRKVQEKIDWYN